MSLDLVRRVLDHATPQRIVSQIQERLNRENEARKDFREWLKPDVKAEFINGEIIMHSPAKRRHNQATKAISFPLEAYVLTKDLGEIAIEKALVGLERNDVEPDVCFWKQSTAVGFTDDMNVYPASDLVVEVLSKSTEARDRGIKKETYEADGVTEYWIVDPVSLTLEQYVLSKNKHGHLVYHLEETYGIEQSLTSHVLPGFTVALRAYFEAEERDAAVRKLMTP